MQDKQQRAIDALQSFLHTPLDAALKRHVRHSPEIEALRLFHEVAITVPAYGAFLKEHGIETAAIQRPEDFRGLPLTSKQNYLLQHPLSDLCRHGSLESCDMIAVSSGSTGKPGFWPRFVSDEFPIAFRFEQVFHDSFEAYRRHTLAVVCFALGTWVGGMYTTACCRHLATKGYSIAVVTPGNNKEEIFRVVEELGPRFHQVVLLGYPPFIKDVVDSGLSRGIHWSKYCIKLVLAGEVFSEEWRSLVCERVGSSNPYYDSASFYGTADAGVLGNETPLSICIRRYLSLHPGIARELFGESRLPTLVQYDPLTRFFETTNGTLLFTGDNGIPLIRYHISDEGGVIPYDEMLNFLALRYFDPVAELLRSGRRQGIRSLPFAYVFGRSNFVVSYFGANIYPENVTVGLEQKGIREWVTGKFVMESREDPHQNRSLSIVVELAPGESASPERQKAAADAILQQLCRLNSEFAHYVPAEHQTPQVVLRPAGDLEWFPQGVKHRYTR